MSNNVVHLDFINKRIIFPSEKQKLENSEMTFEQRFQIFVSELTTCFIKHEMKLHPDMIEDFDLFLTDIFDYNKLDEEGELE